MGNPSAVVSFSSAKRDARPFCPLPPRGALLHAHSLPLPVSPLQTACRVMAAARLPGPCLPARPSEMLASVCWSAHWLVTLLPTRYSDRMFEKHTVRPKSVLRLITLSCIRRQPHHLHQKAPRFRNSAVGFPFDWLHVGILNHFCGLCCTTRPPLLLL